MTAARVKRVGCADPSEARRPGRGIGRGGGCQSRSGRSAGSHPPLHAHVQSSSQADTREVAPASGSLSRRTAGATVRVMAGLLFDRNGVLACWCWHSAVPFR